MADSLVLPDSLHAGVERYLILSETGPLFQWGVGRPRPLSFSSFFVFRSAPGVFGKAVTASGRFAEGGVVRARRCGFCSPPGVGRPGVWRNRVATRLLTAGAPHWGVLPGLMPSDICIYSLRAMRLDIPSTFHRFLHAPVHSGGVDYCEIHLSDATKSGPSPLPLPPRGRPCTPSRDGGPSPFSLADLLPPTFNSFITLCESR